MPTDVHFSSADPADPKTLGGAADYETTLPLSEDEGAAELSDHIGRFKIHERLGAGGMGVVYRAHDPRLDRPVALKLLLVEGDDTERARLQREAQALACLSHPNVVQVYESGVHHGRSYVVMELVVGQTLDRWLKAETRSLDEILEVFTQAGQGLAAAHEAGLVHRDFKPGNVMVGDDGRVRVFDFGLAQGLPFLARDDSDLEESGAMDAFSTEQRAELWTLTLTRAGKMLGTPAFMSPEQYDRRPTTAASDQFSFCVALFSALLGEHPFIDDPQEWYKLPHLVGEGVTRAVPKWRSLPRRIRRALRRGLAVDPRERWPSMPALLDALRGGRRRWWVVTGVASVVSLTAVAAGLYLLTPSPPPGCQTPEDGLRGTWDEPRREKIRQALLSTNVTYADQTWTRVRDRLDDHAARWINTLGETCQAAMSGLHSERQLDLDLRCLDQDRRVLQAQIDVLASADERVVRNAVQALESLEPAERCLQHEPPSSAPDGPVDPELARQAERIRERLAYVEACQLMGRFEEGLDAVTVVIEEAQALEDGALEARALKDLGNLQLSLGRYAESAEHLEAAYFLATREGVDAVARDAAIRLLFVYGVWIQDFDVAHTWANHARSILERNDDEVARAQYFNNLGGTYEVEDRDEEAQSVHEQALAIRERVLGPNDFRVGVSLHNLAIVLVKQERLALARAYIERTHSIWETMLGPEHPQTARALNVMAEVLEQQGDHAESERRARTAVAMFERSLGPEHPMLGNALDTLANALVGQGRYQEALATYERAMAIWEPTFGDEHQVISQGLIKLASLELARDRPRAALPHVRRALTNREREGASARDLAEVRWILAQALWQSGEDQTRAIEMAELALRGYESLGDPGRSKREDIREWLNRRSQTP